MRKGLIALLFVMIMVERAISATVPSVPATLDPSTKKVTITLGNKIPDQTEIRLVRIGEYSVETEPPKDGKLTVPLPKLLIAGPAKIDVIGKDDTVVASSVLADVDEASSILGMKSSLFVIFVYVLLIVSLPWAATIIDISKGYRDQRAKWKDLLNKVPGNINLDQLRALLPEMDQGPPGTSGLTRGAVALTLLLIIGIALFHIVVFVPGSHDIVEKLLTLLAGAFTSITGFYFGSRAVTQDVQAQPRSSPSSGPGTSPAIISVAPASGAPGVDVTLAGRGFGTSGTVLFGSVPATTKSWNDTSITATVPTLGSGLVKIAVTPTGGSPLQVDFTVTSSQAQATT